MRIVALPMPAAMRPALTPISAPADLDAVAAAPAGLTLQGWVALDAQGNRTTVRLANQRYGAPVGDEAFRWDDPRKRGRPS